MLLAVFMVLVCIQAPSISECLFVNRKGFHSINVEVVCEADTTDAMARWYGSTHDLEGECTGTSVRGGTARWPNAATVATL